MTPGDGRHDQRDAASQRSRRTSRDPRARGSVTSTLHKGVISILRLHTKESDNWSSGKSRAAGANQLHCLCVARTSFLEAPRVPEQSRGHAVRYFNACDWLGRDRERRSLGRELGHLSSRLLRLHRAGRAEPSACARAGKICDGEHSTRPRVPVPRREQPRRQAQSSRSIRSFK